jgi:outer membrane protein OmpA-like peptidoglycan-associated protein
MKTFRKASLYGAVLSAGLLMASGAMAQHAQYTEQDVIKNFGGAPQAAQKPCCDPKAADACPPNTTAGDDGVCDPVVSTRGFSLAEPGAGSAHSAPPKATAPASTGHVAATGPVHRTPVPHTPVRLTSAAVSSGDLLITFKTGSTEITEQGRANAKVFASALNNPALVGAHFEISGHTDSSGTAAKNEALSQARAEAVKSLLMTDGVDGGRLNAKGYGSEKPVSGLSAAAPANRRVEARRVDVNG